MYMYRGYAIQRAYSLEESSLLGQHVRTVHEILEQGFADYEHRELRIMSGLGDMIESFDFVDNKILR